MGRDEGNGEGHEEGLDEDAEGREEVTLVDVDGKEHEFVVLAVVEVDALDYAMLAPTEQVDNEEQEGDLDLFLFRYDEAEDGTVSFSEIEDEATYEKVREYCSKELLEIEDGEEAG